MSQINAHPKKRFGQHWLQSEKALHQILRAAAVEKGDRILEIGPGTGILTRWLVKLAEAVVAVEIDSALAQQLRQSFVETEHFRLIEGDFLELDLPEILAQAPEFSVPNKVVANIPYYITGPILEKLLGTIADPHPAPYETIVLLLQKEVAERICAAPGSRTFGALSVRVQYLADCELIAVVPAKAFAPPPKVDSAIVKLTPRSPHQPAVNPKNLETLVSLGFATKRKMLRNNLKSLVDRDVLTSLMTHLDINPQARAEDLGVESWIALSNHLQPDVRG
ncbi:MAG: 16S rRNA (adenine(1518)-N(6)/adenine(1519)-N(6))-dimethyltransferase RsmA [Synechococcales bacterium]|nr:16S rRNA (adenine(1518)-N(6)/adenine(1519)-N(6))-dimethyltransferase RsmA [Synechococcales bacterium]